MYNYYRWFPTGKIIFTAPTKPLVRQQVEACFDVVGIPERDTAHLDGNTPADKRRGSPYFSTYRIPLCIPNLYYAMFLLVRKHAWLYCRTEVDIASLITAFIYTHINSTMEGTSSDILHTADTVKWLEGWDLWSSQHCLRRGRWSS
jgi:hypothetical protein